MAGEVLKILGQMLVDGSIKDPRLQMISFTDVVMSDDLRHAKVFFSQIGSEEERQHTKKTLERSAHFIQWEAAKRLRLRYVPDMRFYFDPSLERGARISKLLHEPEPEATTDEDGENHD